MSIIILANWSTICEFTESQDMWECFLRRNIWVTRDFDLLVQAKLQRRSLFYFSYSNFWNNTFMRRTIFIHFKLFVCFEILRRINSFHDVIFEARSIYRCISHSAENDIHFVLETYQLASTKKSQNCMHVSSYWIYSFLLYSWSFLILNVWTEMHGKE